MPMVERVQLARAIANKHGHRITEVEDWRPLLVYAQGNPLTISVLVGQAFHDGLRTREQVDRFVNHLRLGEAQLVDQQRNRDGPLGASLARGFESAFTPHEREILAVLHLFQACVNVDVLSYMGKPEARYCLQRLRDVSIDQATQLLDRASEIGLLVSHRDGFYGIHPALPWYFQHLFERIYGPPNSPEALAADRAFVAVIGGFADYYHDQYGDGRIEVVSYLALEEFNLLRAWRVARNHGWWDRIIGPMQGLCILYDEYSGRKVEWARLVREVVADVTDMTHGGPLPGREIPWRMVTGYRARIAQDARNWSEAERLRRSLVAWDRENASLALKTPEGALDNDQRLKLRMLSATTNGLGTLLFKRRRPDCLAFLRESADLSHRSRDHNGEAQSLYNIGLAYLFLPELRDLDQAERFFQASLHSSPESNVFTRSACLSSIGDIALVRLKESLAAHEPEDHQLHYLSRAIQSHEQAFDLLPPSATEERAKGHDNLGKLALHHQPW
jgi:tetratricopeptide (TPR) repeat protein